MDPTITPQTTTTPTTSGGEDDGGPKDPTNIIKGKRTKRQRPTFLTHSSTSNTALNPSPTTSSDFPAGSTTTEDEDTANCLILLSKGHNISNQNNNMGEFSGYKFNSKRYIQTSTDAVRGLTGIYVYDCKTCSRTFSSFQALGGHRASHKKPRINEPETRKPPPYTSFSDKDEPENRHRIISSPVTTKKPSSKLHDCSVCGAEFNSGQALGGHMRRHRAVNGGTATNTTLSLIPYNLVTTMVTDDRDNHKLMNDGLCLDLDLNLPAPPEIAVAGSDQDQRRESSFKLTANQNKQQQPTVHLFATPTLVDCHY
ncbi:hypothetical protein L1987_75456 [Smallanthus sonchifolius]|uniref:Uncharacterized protein n=1 Tax=Smallanthus sonchifolius TaxID=185202 RepID=A0ACB9A5W0_9ASTR|nr:hypothetical protein L1987_75456 [Smallanthus sonchifolius]